MFLNIIKATTYDKPRINHILNRKQLKPFLLKVMNEIRLSAFSTLFNIILEFLARTIRQEEEIKGIQIGKEEINLSLFVDDMILS
jgi:hypothetical protein